MHAPAFLINLLIYLAAAVIAVPLFKRLGLGSVLGYLVAGLIIGPSVTGLVSDSAAVLQISELGVVFLLFLVGLELNPKRLWEMRNSIFGLGGLQVSLTIALATGALLWMGQSSASAVVIGMAIAMSSTAIALQVLAERNIMKLPSGQAAFAVSLFQDIAVVPLMLIIGLLASAAPGQNGAAGAPLIDWAATATAIGLLVGLILVGRLLLRPVLRIVAATGMREIFIAAALLVIVGSAILTASVGLSLAMGAFMAGVLLADSEYRLELEVDIEPFKGLLLGLFFIAVGMSIDLALILKQPLLVLALALAAVALKLLVLFGLAWAFKLCRQDAWVFALSVSQVGEFAFVLTALAQGNALLSPAQAGLTNAVVALSMLATPLMFLAYDALIAPRYNTTNTRPADTIQERNTVIIAGVGRFGQIISRLLAGHGHKLTLIDHDPNQIELLRGFNWHTYYGDARRPDVLENAGIAQAQLVVLAMDDPQAVLETARHLKEHHPQVKVLARARSRTDAYALMDIGVQCVRETFGASLMAAEQALQILGLSPYAAHRSARQFERFDQALLHQQYALREDRKQLLAISDQARLDLRALLEREANNPLDWQQPGPQKPGEPKA
jgi:monovalent cation:proton antiporter-2 (CPA2) family protein